MDADQSTTVRSFGEEHFGAADLGDARLTARLVKTADCFLSHPGGTLPQKLNRNADLFEFIEAVEEAGDHYLIRSKSNRNIQILDGGGDVTGTKLHDWARLLPSQGTRTVQVAANHGQKARSATVRVASGKVTLQAPHFARGEHSSRNIVAFVVHVEETCADTDAGALEWILLTNVKAESFVETAERIDWYACRPVIEEFHKAQKTGCGIELPQFTTGPALQAAIAVLSVVATQLLRLRDLSRRPDAATRPATDVVDVDYVEAVSLWRFNEVRENLSVHDFFKALAKLGGHLNRKGDGSPGWLVLWRGWTQLQLLVAGARGARRRQCV